MIDIYNISHEEYLEDLFANEKITNHPSGNHTSSLTSHTDLTSPEVNDDISDPEGGIIKNLLNLDKTKDIPPYHDNPLSGSTTSSSPRNGFYLEDSVDKNSLDDNFVYTLSEMFTDKHALDYSSPPLWDEYDDELFNLETVNDNIYDDPFDSKEENIKDSKILIDELDPPGSSDFLPFLECDSVFYEDFSEVDALSSTNNEDKIFNPAILIHENLFEVTLRVTPEKNVKKLTNASLILENFNPPLYELPFHKEVLGSETLLSFSSKNEEKVFNPGILTSKGVYTSLLPKLSHRGPKAFKVIKIFESPMEIFPCSYGEDIHVLDVPCLHFYPPLLVQDFPDCDDSRACSFVLRLLYVFVLLGVESRFAWKRISNKKMKNEAKMTKPSTEWKSVKKTKSKSKSKSTLTKSKVKAEAVNEEILNGPTRLALLISVSQICDKKNNVLFIDTECLVLSSDFKLLDESQVLLRVPRNDNIYNVDLKSVVPTKGLTCLFAKATIDESSLWHRRLGHINFKNMNKLVRGNLVRCLPSKIFENDILVLLVRKESNAKPPDETSGILKTFITEIRNQLDYKVKVIKSDNGTEFKNSVMNQFCEMKGIRREFSVARTPQQNGVVERKNRTLIEAARTMLVDSKLPTTFWAEVVNTTCYVINRVLVIKPHTKTPYELIRGRTPLIDFMKPFGCPITILNTRDFIGYSVSVSAGNQTNIIAGQAKKKIEPEQEYILIPFYTTDPLISQGPKDSEEDVSMKPTKVNESGAFDKGEENEQDTRSEFERILQQEKQTNITNSFNTVGTHVSAAGPSFTNDDPSSPVNVVEATNAFEDHLFEQFSPFKNAFALPHVLNV
ncbi:ribonuclease H-like domain-containing protein, partial [Tanacetum coccineum]